jgi:uncharacterized protein with HEPN domain
MRKDDVIRLQHMLDAAREAIAFAHNRSRVDLNSDRQLAWALAKAIEIIGEAACQVSPTAQAELPDIPWADIIGMRHRLVHAYFDINLNILWRTVQNDLPPLIAELKRALPEEIG